MDTFKWLLVLVLLFFNFTVLPMLLMCIFWSPWVALSITPIPLFYLIREQLRKDKCREASKTKWKTYPNALKEYIKLLDKD